MQNACRAEFIRPQCEMIVSNDEPRANEFAPIRFAVNLRRAEFIRARCEWSYQMMQPMRMNSHLPFAVNVFVAPNSFGRGVK